MIRPNYEPKRDDNGVLWRAVWDAYPEERDQHGPFISEEAAQLVCDRLNPSKEVTL